MSKKVSVQNPNNLVKAINISDDNTITMTTLEIAELTNRRHDTVMRECDTNLSKVCTLHLFAERYKTSRGNEYTCYRLPKREVLILVSGYSVELRTAIIDRLEYLEKQLNKKPESKLEWIQFALEQEKQIIALQEQVEQDAPKVDTYDKFFDKSQYMTGSDVFKVIKSHNPKVKQVDVFNYLKNHKIFYKHKGDYCAYASAIENGLAVNKNIVIEVNGENKDKVYGYLTGKGAEKVIKHFTIEKIKKSQKLLDK